MNGFMHKTYCIELYKLFMMIESDRMSFPVQLYHDKEISSVVQ